MLMKRIFILCFALWSALYLNAQQETVFGNVENIGAFGGPFIEIGSINGQIGADVGGGGAIILDEFFIGGFGQGTSYPDVTIDNLNWNIKFGHGGLWFGYVERSYKVIHLYSSFKLGWGRAQLRRDNFDTIRDRVLVLTPEIGAEVNLTDFFKISFAGGYRWVNGVTQLPTLGNSDFSSPVGILTFRFGGFDGDWDEW